MWAGRVGVIRYLVNDVDVAVKFYIDMLGFELQQPDRAVRAGPVMNKCGAFRQAAPVIAPQS